MPRVRLDEFLDLPTAEPHRSSYLNEGQAAGLAEPIDRVGMDPQEAGGFRHGQQFLASMTRRIEFAGQCSAAWWGDFVLQLRRGILGHRGVGLAGRPG
ncbi:MAG: hypothetical protein U0638_05430 [Phycisphaerales bacterium]